MDLKYSKWKWQNDQSFNFNISFLDFKLKYSGETCLQERVIINSTGNITVGKYCGRRYPWSVFTSHALITLEFYTFDSFRSYFMLQYQINNYNLTSSMLTQKHCIEFNSIESNCSVLPYSSISNYKLMSENYYNWNIFVSKMFKLSVQLTKAPNKKGTFYFYDGPNFHSIEYDATIVRAFTSSSFQVSVLYQGQYSDIEMKFISYIFKNVVKNYNKYVANDKFEISSRHLECSQKSIILCAFSVIVPRDFYVNITLLSLNYNGPNIEYCKYGGLSIYDYVRNAMKEVFLICDNWFPVSSNYQPDRIIITNKNNIFVVFYSYQPFSDIDIQMIIEPTVCQGVHVQR